MSKYLEKKDLIRSGYEQGDNTDIEPTPCNVCGKKVRQSMSWWMEGVCYCRNCAVFRNVMSDWRR